MEKIIQCVMNFEIQKDRYRIYSNIELYTHRENVKLESYQCDILSKIWSSN